MATYRLTYRQRVPGGAGQHPGFQGYPVTPGAGRRGWQTVERHLELDPQALPDPIELAREYATGDVISNVTLEAL